MFVLLMLLLLVVIIVEVEVVVVVVVAVIPQLICHDLISTVEKSSFKKIFKYTRFIT